MPYANPDDKKAWQARWKAHGKRNGYNKWLYGRRKLRFQDAEEFRRALEKIAASRTFPIKSDEIARAALTASDERYRILGPSPKIPSIGESIEEVLKRLGLPQ